MSEASGMANDREPTVEAWRALMLDRKMGKQDVIAE
jgi:hypothetical protein